MSPCGFQRRLLLRLAVWLFNRHVAVSPTPLCCSCPRVRGGAAEGLIAHGGEEPEGGKRSLVCWSSSLSLSSPSSSVSGTTAYVLGTERILLTQLWMSQSEQYPNLIGSSPSTKKAYPSFLSRSVKRQSRGAGARRARHRHCPCRGPCSPVCRSEVVWLTATFAAASVVAAVSLPRLVFLWWQLLPMLPLRWQLLPLPRLGHLWWPSDSCPVPTECPLPRPLHPREMTLLLRGTEGIL